MEASANDTAYDSTYKAFKTHLKKSWKQSPKCDHEQNTCACRKPFYRMNSLIEWMLTAHEQHKQKLNIELLLEREKPISNRNFDDPKTVFDSSNQCIRVFSILLKLKRGNLIYIFQDAGITDEHLDKNLEKSHPSYRKLIQGLKGCQNLGCEPEKIFDDFEDEKWNFSPVYLEYSMDKEFGKLYRLPFCERRVISKGGTASVMEGLVHEEFVSTELKKYLEEPGFKPDHGGMVSMIAFLGIF